MFNVKKMGKIIANNKLKVLVSFIFFICLLIVIISNSFAITGEVPSIILKSVNLDYDISEEGAWKVTKSAEWTAYGKAQITFDIDSIAKKSTNPLDLILVLDSSTSMHTKKLNLMKSNVTSLITEILNGTDNRVALISFTSTAEILSDFSNDVEGLSAIVDTIESKGVSSYYQALVGVSSILENYTASDERNVVVLFFTDGYPNRDSPNEVGQYNYLKSTYSYVEINAIQYGKSDQVKAKIERMSDYQYIATDTNMLDVFRRASSTAMAYSDFSIRDLVSEYFNVDAVDSDLGEVSTADNTINWTFGKTFKSGFSAKMTIAVSLKDEYLSNFDLYGTNSEEEIVSAIDSINEDVLSTETPILSNGYTVTYEANSPSMCVVSNVPSSSKYGAFDVVSIPEEAPVCNGYQFKNWEIVTDGVSVVGDNTFIMPSKDVTLRGVWSKITLSKSMDGTISGKAYLYNILQNEATSLGLAKEYTGEHQDSVNGGGDSKIYYYYAKNDTEANSILNKNNVVFAGHCWQMFRTTDTGGVKMIYKGEVDSNGTCATTRESHVGYNGFSTINLTGSYYYGTDYTYDSTTKLFSLAGTKTLSRWSSSTSSSLFGQYTCISASEDGTCSTLYYIASYNSLLSANALAINSNASYSQFGTVKFNMNDNSLSYVGYMYDTIYSTNYNAYGASTSKEDLVHKDNLKTSYYYADSVSWDASSGEWSLVNPYKVDSKDEYTSLIGKYTFTKSKEDYTSDVVYYIGDVQDSNDFYYLELENGNDITYYDTVYAYGDTYTDNRDGTFSIVNPTVFKKSAWSKYYNDVLNKYICVDVDTTTNKCSVVRYVTSTTRLHVDYYDSSTSGLKYASGFSYDNGIYVLNDDYYMLWDYRDTGSMERLSNAHYTCFNTTGECSTLAYVYYVENSRILDRQNVYYISLSDYVDIDWALMEMLDANINDSTIKDALDAWYKKYLNEYTYYIEDAIYCNDRSMGEAAGWNPIGGSVVASVIFGNDSLYCKDENDRFAVSNMRATLDYPVGLITKEELGLLNNDLLRKTGSSYATLSPLSFKTTTVYVSYVDAIGAVSSGSPNSEMGLRPVISLKKGIVYSGGNGSVDSPYIVNISDQE